ncbi:hypothetical protein TSAR_012455 [Trichomalopsis sarcophagae]|uniref:Uncharacterized protein n=1 Tax=Trichomalopsis sarcophagae TaxID=543379 RepID=A0A232FGG4_9HYME|nr:hypothetical protein TSAR_012455 [Trichomalopsis sarcophagae]
MAKLPNKITTREVINLEEAYECQAYYKLPHCARYCMQHSIKRCALHYTCALNYNSKAFRKVRPYRFSLNSLYSISDSIGYPLVARLFIIGLTSHQIRRSCSTKSTFLFHKSKPDSGQPDFYHHQVSLSSNSTHVIWLEQLLWKIIYIGLENTLVDSDDFNLVVRLSDNEFYGISLPLASTVPAARGDTFSRFFIRFVISYADRAFELLEDDETTLRKDSRESRAKKDNNNLCAFSNPELDMISKDIKELIQEKHGLEQDISQKEADIKIKNGEIKSLQSELDTLAATLKQLDNQKVEAQKRLNDLQTQVEKLRQQASDQESNLHVHESELNNKRQEIECLKQAEQNLETKQHSCNQNLNSLSQLLQSVQLQISQTKAKMTQLEEQQRQIVDVITQYDAALTIGDASVITDSLLTFKAELNRATVNGTGNLKQMNNKDSYNNNDVVENDNNFTSFENRKNDNEIDRDPFENNLYEGRNQNIKRKNEIKDSFRLKKIWWKRTLDR